MKNYSKLDKQILKLPDKTIWCKKCVISNQRPRIIFDKKNICSACNNLEYKKRINWKKRDEEFHKLLDKYRGNGSEWDVVVPSSGGKDSGYVAHKLKYEYGMNPLLVTWSPLKYTDIGIKNFNSLNDSGFVNIKCSPNGIIHRKLSRLCFEELGDAFHTFVLGQMYFPIHIANKFQIKLIFYGENGEVEYAGDAKSVDKPYIDFLKDKKWVNGYLKGTTIDQLIKYGIKNKNYLSKEDLFDSDLCFYKPPSIDDLKKNKISRIYYYNYYHQWNPQENYYYCTQNTGFQANLERTEGTYSKYSSIDDKMDGMHYFMRYIKFGLGRCMEDAAHEIRDGHITRDEGIALMNKFEGEFPKKHFKEFLEYLNISEKEFWRVVDSWRLKHIWKKNKGKWNLRYPIK
ncbi:N-acetyl sugar amidotransferase [Pelagibacteraceae bacterium]|nr:N-acetyl sugar amidotransferase [Pelagibacteraceae bacterium]